MLVRQIQEHKLGWLMSAKEDALQFVHPAPQFLWFQRREPEYNRVLRRAAVSVTT